MSDRFFIPTPTVGDTAVLAGTEAHHLMHVLRAKVGDSVVLFDGAGNEFTARVEKTSKHAVELSISERRKCEQESTSPLTLAVALPKGDRQKWLIEKTVELGVARLLPLVTERGVAQPVETALGRLRRAVIEASKQSGRKYLMEIGEPANFEQLVQDFSHSSLKLVAHPGGMPLQQAWSAADVTNQTQSAIVAIGPEGGFTDAEIERLRVAGWALVSLGSTVLRIETAAIAVAAWANFLAAGKKQA